MSIQRVFFAVFFEMLFHGHLLLSENFEEENIKGNSEASLSAKWHALLTEATEEHRGKRP